MNGLKQNKRRGRKGNIIHRPPSPRRAARGALSESVRVHVTTSHLGNRGNTAFFFFFFLICILSQWSSQGASTAFPGGSEGKKKKAEARLFFFTTDYLSSTSLGELFFGGSGRGMGSFIYLK